MAQLVARCIGVVAAGPSSGLGSSAGSPLSGRARAHAAFFFFLPSSAPGLGNPPPLRDRWHVPGRIGSRLSLARCSGGGWTRRHRLGLAGREGGRIQLALAWALLATPSPGPGGLSRCVAGFRLRLGAAGSPSDPPPPPRPRLSRQVPALFRSTGPDGEGSRCRRRRVRSQAGRRSSPSVLTSALDPAASCARENAAQARYTSRPGGKWREQVVASQRCSAVAGVKKAPPPPSSSVRRHAVVTGRGRDDATSLLALCVREGECAYLSLALSLSLSVCVCVRGRGEGSEPVVETRPTDEARARHLVRDPCRPMDAPPCSPRRRHISSSGTRRADDVKRQTKAAAGRRRIAHVRPAPLPKPATRDGGDGAMHHGRARPDPGGGDPRPDGEVSASPFVSVSRDARRGPASRVEALLPATDGPGLQPGSGPSRCCCARNRQTRNEARRAVRPLVYSIPENGFHRGTHGPREAATWNGEAEARLGIGRLPRIRNGIPPGGDAAVRENCGQAALVGPFSGTPVLVRWSDVGDEARTGEGTSSAVPVDGPWRASRSDRLRGIVRPAADRRVERNGGRAWISGRDVLHRDEAALDDDMIGSRRLGRPVA
ncbi:hypothetical protein CDD83_8624 [Cordyceps sp. RAO-2017]|nr:hypothetical protein CDD83_8624 [Cordyceps sp. RAO-2017]